MINIDKYLNLIQEQNRPEPVEPVERPEPVGATNPNQIKPKTPQAPNVKINHDRPISSFFNYMTWTTKIIKQGEIFRKNCYNDNCGQFALGTGDRRICKDRCDIETCKKIISMLRISSSKCKDSKNPQLCKVRYAQLIPLYEKKLMTISQNYIKDERIQKETKPKVG